MVEELSPKISDKLLRLYRKWPFSTTKAARIIKEYYEYESRIFEEEQITDEYYSIEGITKYFVIPLEQADSLIVAIQRLNNIYRAPYGVFINLSEMKERVHATSPLFGGRFHGGSLSFAKSEFDNIDSAYITIAHVEESLLLVSIKTLPSDTIRYLFYGIIKRHRSRHPILHKNKIHRYFKSVGYTEYPIYDQIGKECFEVFEKYKKTLKKVFSSLEQLSLIEIPILFNCSYSFGIISEKRIASRKIMPWSNIGLADMTLEYISDNNEIYVPYNINSSDGAIFCFVDINKCKLEQMYQSYSHKLFNYEDDMLNYFFWSLIKDSLANKVYMHLVAIRQEIIMIENKKLGKKYQGTFKRLVKEKYVFDRIFEENRRIGEREARWNGVSNINVLFSQKEIVSDYISFNHEQIDYKTKKIRYIIKSIFNTIEGNNSIENERSNSRIQALLIVLTIITIVIGIVQIFIAARTI